MYSIVSERISVSILNRWWCWCCSMLFMFSRLVRLFRLMLISFSMFSVGVSVSFLILVWCCMNR